MYLKVSFKDTLPGGVTVGDKCEVSVYFGKGWSATVPKTFLYETNACGCMLEFRC